ncbi:hypothetical protein Hanom_Chr04g00378601 [Helianthus anomalus]
MGLNMISENVYLDINYITVEPLLVMTGLSNRRKRKIVRWLREMTEMPPPSDDFLCKGSSGHRVLVKDNPCQPRPVFGRDVLSGPERRVN